MEDRVLDTNHFKSLKGVIDNFALKPLKDFLVIKALYYTVILWHGLGHNDSASHYSGGFCSPTFVWRRRPADI